MASDPSRGAGRPASRTASRPGEGVALSAATRPSLRVPTRPALRERYDRRRQEVVNAAAAVFAQHGYHATSIEDLIAATGMTRGGIYHYTSSKQELLLSIVNELMEPLLARAEEVLQAPASAEEHLRELMRVWLEHVAAHRDHMIVFSRERGTLERTPEWRGVRAARARFEGLLEAVLHAGRRDGSFHVRDPQMALLMILGAVNYIPEWLDVSGRLSPAQIADRYCDLLLEGLLAR